MSKITGSDVGIIVSIIGCIASVIVIVLNALKGESVGVGIGLLLFCSLSLLRYIKDKKQNK